MIFNSIRWRLQAWHSALLVAIVAGFGFTAHRLATSNRLKLIDEELQAQSTQLGIAVPPTSDGESQRNANRRPPPREGNLLDQITAGGCYFIVWQPDGTVQTSSSNAPSGITPPSHIKGEESHVLRTQGTSREFIRFTRADRCFLVGRDIQKELAELRTFDWYLAAAGAGVLAFGFVGGWLLSTRAIRPIADISDTAEKIAAGDLSQRIQGEGFSEELQRLAHILNSTFSRLDAAFTQQARFTADAAHELRTPVSIMLMQAQNGLASDHLTDEQREAFEASQRAAQRMRRLIDSLLELTRFDAGQEVLQHNIIDLAGNVRDCIALVQPIAEARRIAIECEASKAMFSGDPDRIAQVITNLLINAIEHNREGGKVHLAVSQENGSSVFIISDNGPGISPEDLPHIFERFYRADSSRSSSSRSSGLGLSISKAIVEAHGGTIETASTPGTGSTFTVRLPAASA